MFQWLVNRKLNKRVQELKAKHPDADVHHDGKAVYVIHKPGVTCPCCGNHDTELIACDAKYEDVLFAYYKDGQHLETSVSVIQPVFTCNKCSMSWTDWTGEVIRNMAVIEARTALQA